MMGRSRRTMLHAAALLVGSGALVFLVHRLGWDGMRRAILGTGAWFAVIAAIDLASVLCDAAGVYRFVTPHAPISYRRVLAAQASGLAINRLTPGNSLGEPIKVTMLMACVPEAAAVSAIVLFNLASYLVAIAAIVVGTGVTLLTLDLPTRFQLVVVIALAAMTLAVSGLVVLARRGALALPIRALRRIRLVSAARAERWTDRIAAIDANMRGFGDASTRRALPFVIGSRLLNMAGSVAILVAVDIPLTASFVIGTLSVGILVTWLSNAIPLGLGLADGGTFALYGALGASPDAGLVFAMINRVRTVVLAAMGLTVMAIANLADRSRPATTSAPPTTPARSPSRHP